MPESLRTFLDLARAWGSTRIRGRAIRLRELTWGQTEWRVEVERSSWPVRRCCLDGCGFVMPDFLLGLDIVDGPVLWVGLGLGCAGLVGLCLRRKRPWVAVAAVAATAGFLVGALVLWLVEGVFNVFGTALGWQTRGWVLALFGSLGFAGANWWESGPWRKAAAGGASVLFVLAAVLGINAHYGLRPTLASLLGITLDRPVELRTPVLPHPARTPGSDLWERWRGPAEMREAGTTGTQVIPNTESVFLSRPAGIYLPPAALVPNPPALPLVVLMMGQPGDPDPRFAAAILDRFASRHQGLAPIVIVADQLGNPLVDNLCLDTPLYGKPETFINKDVVAWARANLNVINDRRYWTIAGYSHGGQCAISFAAKYPNLWGNVLDISGEEYPGAERPEINLREVFGGDRAAYEEQKPVNILRAHRYKDTTAVFTVADDDPDYIGAARKLSAAARSAGMTVTYHEVPNGGHVIGALNGGLREGFRALYPRLGLARPPEGRQQ